MGLGCVSSKTVVFVAEGCVLPMNALGTLTCRRSVEIRFAKLVEYRVENLCWNNDDDYYLYLAALID